MFKIGIDPPVNLENEALNNFQSTRLDGGNRSKVRRSEIRRFGYEAWGILLVLWFFPKAGYTSALPMPSAFYCAVTETSGAGQIFCTVALDSASTSSGVIVHLSSSDSAITVPQTVTVPAKQTTVGFQASVRSVTDTRTVTLQAQADNLSKTVELVLKAANPALSVSKTSVKFGDIALNASAKTAITINSMGNAPVTITAILFSGPGFAVTELKLPLTLVPGGIQWLNLQFSPTTPGPAIGTLTIRSNSSASATSEVALSGSGIDASRLADVVVDTTPGMAVSATFMGLSHEWGIAQTVMGDSATGVNNSYRQLLRNLTSFGSGPIQLRVGGNSTDKSIAPAPNTAQPFAELANALGVHFDLGVNLGSDNVNLAAEQTEAFVSQMPKGSLDSIEIGNEPDEYVGSGMRPPPYSYQDYQTDFDTWKTRIMPLLPSNTKLMGPSYATSVFRSDTAAFDSAEAGALAIYSQHHYAGDGKANNPDDILLTPNAASSGVVSQATYVAITHKSGALFRIGELNSLYNGGENGISNAFESALWAADIMFEYANIGVDGVNWHTGYRGSGYDAFGFDIRPSGANTSYELTSVTPLYYGLFFFQAATGNSARLLPVTLYTQANLTAWATVDASGTKRLVLINKDEKATGPVGITLSGYSHAQIYRLTAPSYLSTSGVTFAGQTFDGSTNGVIQGTQTVDSINASDGVFEIPMPVTSAAIVTFSK